MNEFEKAKLALLEREAAVREGELSQKLSEAKLSRWRSPLVVAVFAAAIGALGNAVVTFHDAQQAHHLAQSNAEHQRILEVIRIGNPSQVRENLIFLIETDLVQDSQTIASIRNYYKDAEAGTGPGSSAPVTSFDLMKRVIDSHPVREWCAPGVAPTLTPAGWGDCSLVTRGDAERLATQAMQLDAEP